MTLTPEEIAARYPGQVTYLAANLQNGWEFGRYADTPMRTASIIKIAIMVEAFAQVAEGRREWAMPLILDNKTSVGGSGILPDLTDGLQLTLRDCVTLMIIVSDNTATNMVLDALDGGPAAVNARMTALGFPLTTVFRKAFSPDNPNDPIGKLFGLGRTTARETVGLLAGLARGEIVSPEASAGMVAILKRQQDKDGLARRLPEELMVASKSGRLSDLRNDAGLVYLPDGGGPLALAIFCDGQPPSSTSRPEDIGLETIAALSETLVAVLRKRNTMHLPFGKPVQASDGTTLGHLDTLIVHADDHRVTHFVIRSGFVLPLDVVAPVENIAEYSDNAVHLRLSAEEAKALPPFVPAQFHLPTETWIPPTPYLSGVGDFLLWSQNAGGELQTLTVSEGAGENFTMTAGTPVYCGETMVGTVDDVLTEETTGLVTHFAVRRGVFFHHDALIAMAQVESADDGGIKLRLTPDEARLLPDYAPR